MDDDFEPPKKSYPVSPSKMSKTPSWIMLGFVLGALTVIALPPLRKEKPEPEPAVVQEREPAAPSAPSEPAQLTIVEAVFAAYAKHAVWDDDTTEIALWNSKEQAFSDFFEVRRDGNTYYFRSIPSLTRRVISRGKPMPESPILFTETEEDYQEWRQHGRKERPVQQDFRPRPTPRPVAPQDPRKSVTRPDMSPAPGQSLPQWDLELPPAAEQKK